MRKLPQLPWSHSYLKQVSRGWMYPSGPVWPATDSQEATASAAVDFDVTVGKPSLVDLLSPRARCVKIDAPWLCDCQNRIIRTSNESLSSILFGRPRLRHSMRCAGLVA